MPGGRLIPARRSRAWAARRESRRCGTSERRLGWRALMTTPKERRGAVMKGFLQDIESLAVKNDEFRQVIYTAKHLFRQVIYTAKHCQLVLMALKPKEEIGAEVHKLDQFFRVEQGTGEAVLDGVRTAIREGLAVVVPARANHNIINTGTVPLKL